MTQTFPLPILEIDRRLRLVAGRVLRASRRYEYFEDLVIEGWIALLECRPHTSWWAYVTKRAEGAMRDFLRKQRQRGMTWVRSDVNVHVGLDVNAKALPPLPPVQARSAPVSAAYKQTRAADRRSRELCRDCPNYSGPCVLCTDCRAKEAARHQTRKASRRQLQEERTVA